VTLQRLRQDWEALAFLPGKQIEDFALRLSNLMQQMARNGDADLMEACAEEKLLCCMSKKYTQIMLAIETLLNFLALSIEEVTRRLKAVQDREGAPHAEPGTVGGKLLYKVQQWCALEKKEGG
jgi:hypothetical protein